MSIAVVKLELIEWILSVQDMTILTDLQKMKNHTSENTVAVQPRQFGCGKGIFTYVAEDFDETPPGFEEYMLP